METIQTCTSKEISDTVWDFLRESLEWPDPYSGELRGLELGGDVE